MFYKKEADLYNGTEKWFTGIAVYNANYELNVGNKDTIGLPIDGWDWHDTPPQEYADWVDFNAAIDAFNQDSDVSVRASHYTAATFGTDAQNNNNPAFDKPRNLGSLFAEGVELHPGVANITSAYMSADNKVNINFDAEVPGNAIRLFVFDFPLTPIIELTKQSGNSFKSQAVSNLRTYLTNQPNVDLVLLFFDV